jgi:hypothetical protein
MSRPLYPIIQAFNAMGQMGWAVEAVGRLPSQARPSMPWAGSSWADTMKAWAEFCFTVFQYFSLVFLIY